MWSALLGLFKFLGGLWDAIKMAIDAYKKARTEGWIADHETVTAAIRDAKTDEERRVLAKRLADVIRSSP